LSGFDVAKAFEIGLMRVTNKPELKGVGTVEASKFHLLPDGGNHAETYLFPKSEAVRGEFRDVSTAADRRMHAHIPAVRWGLCFTSSFLPALLSL
jgi:hypothetical protein